MTSAASEGERRERLPRARRITSSREIRTLFQRGKRSRTAHLDVFVSASPVAYSRVGVVVPRHKHRVVERNRVKRWLREIVRRELLPRLDSGGEALDLMVRARRESYDATFRELKEELLRWLERRGPRGSSSG